MFSTMALICSYCAVRKKKIGEVVLQPCMLGVGSGPLATVEFEYGHCQTQSEGRVIYHFPLQKGHGVVIQVNNLLGKMWQYTEFKSQDRVQLQTNFIFLHFTKIKRKRGQQETGEENKRTFLFRLMGNAEFRDLELCFGQGARCHRQCLGPGKYGRGESHRRLQMFKVFPHEGQDLMMGGPRW